MYRTISVLFGLLLLTPGASAWAQTPAASSSQSSIFGTGLPQVAVAPDETYNGVGITAIGSDEDRNYIQFVVGNFGEDPLHDVVVKIEIHDASGMLIATDTTSGVRPQTLYSGEFGVGSTFISGDFPADSTVSAKVVDFTSGVRSGGVQIRFGQVNLVDDRIVGEFIPLTAVPNNEVVINGVCLDAEGSMIAGDYTRVEEPMIAGDPVTFQVDLNPWSPEKLPCASFVVAG